MLHDRVLDDRTGLDADGQLERRRAERVPYPAEVTLLWHHDPQTLLRYRLLDASDLGLRIHSSTPVLRGTTGMTLRLLPEGTPLERPIMVVWCQRTESGDGYEVGLSSL